MRNLELSTLSLTLSAFVLLHPSPSLQAQQPVDFSGTWRQDLSRSVPLRKSSRARELKIQQIGQVLTVQVTTKTGEGLRTLNLKYEIGGQELVYTGLDGDEFHTKVRWEHESLVFDTIEHERGKQIVSRQIWTLADGRKILREVKQVKDADEPAESLAIYESSPDVSKE
jgi:hypothetical protein